MKRLYFLLVLMTQFIFAQTPFEKGNDLYQKGKYNEAIKAYESILKSGQESAEVYFNLGNCYYKLNKVAPAVYNFEKAKKINPLDGEIQNNLTFAQKMAIDDIQEAPKVGFSKLIADFTSCCHYDSWAWVAVAMAILMLVCFIGYYFSGTTTLKRIFFSGMLFFVFMVLMSLFSGFYEKNRIQNDKPAIVFTDVIEVKSEPNKSATTSFTLHAGTKVQILESLNNYHKIQLADLKEGWIEKSAVKEIK